MASRFATLTSRPIGAAYLEMGTFTTAVMVLSIFADFFISMSVVALVTAGLISSVVGISFDVNAVAVALLTASAVLLFSGKYARLETVIKILVLGFTLLIVVVAFSASAHLATITTDIWPAVPATSASLLFVIAVAAWMPTPLSVSFYVSAWTVEKQKTKQGSTDDKALSADNDFIFGYSLTIVLALCFTLAGAAFMFAASVTPANTAAGFASQLIKLFTDAIGTWGWGIIAIAAVGVMVSTVVSLMDGTCRSLEFTAHSLFGERKIYFPILLLLQILGSALILYSFASSFTLFLDIATSTAFISAPLVAYYNFKALKREGLVGATSSLMKNWTYAAVVLLTCVLVLYLYTLMT